MDVFFNDIPEEGLHLEGHFPETIFGLSPTDPIRPSGPVSYEADLYAFEEVVAIAGHLRGPFQLQCGTCLEYFPYEADFPNWSAEVDREAGQDGFDFQDLVREEFLLHLPTHPRCDEFVAGRICPRADLLKQSDEESDPGSSDSADPAGEDGPTLWSALDDWK